MNTRTVGKFRIRRFDPMASLKKPFNMVLLGKKASGKSTLMRDILFHLYTMGYPRIVVFSGTEMSNHFYSKHVPLEYIHYDLDLDILANILAVQKQIHSAVNDLEIKLQRSTGIDTRLVIVLDDVVYQKGVLSNDLFRLIYFQGRHVNISLIVASQYLMYIPVEHRPNIDFLVCTKEHIPKNRQKLFENFFGCFADKTTFFYILDQLTQNYEVCIHDNTTNETLPEQQVKWYKAAVTLPQFRFSAVVDNKI